MFIDVSLMLMHNTYKSMLKNLSNLSKNDNRQQHNTLSNSNMSMLFLLPKTVSLRRWISRRVYNGNVMNSPNSQKKTEVRRRPPYLDRYKHSYYIINPPSTPRT